MPTKKLDFDKPDPDIARFVTVCAIGRVVRANLKALFDATNRKSKPDWAGIIDLINVFIDRVLPASGAQQNPSDQIEWMKTMLSGFSKTWLNTNPQLSMTLDQIVKQIQPFSKGELRKHLEELYGAGFVLAQQCVKQWGGAQARRMLDRERDVTLTCAANGKGPTYACCDKRDDGRSTVCLFIGNSNNILKSYLSFEFYFFHECLSHLLPEWDDLSGKLSEGYLYALEKAYFRANCHLLKHGFNLHPRVVDEDMKEHRTETGKGASGFEDLEGVYVWLDSNTASGTLALLFLNLSSMKNGGTRTPEKLLALLEMVGGRQEASLVDLLSQHADDPDALYKELRDRTLPQTIAGGSATDNRSA